MLQTQSQIIKFLGILCYKLACVSLCVCLSVCLSVRNRLPNHRYYGDEAFTGDSLCLE